MRAGEVAVAAELLQLLRIAGALYLEPSVVISWISTMWPACTTLVTSRRVLR
jgi:hypothetical protein